MERFDPSAVHIAALLQGLQAPVQTEWWLEARPPSKGPVTEWWAKVITPTRQAARGYLWVTASPGRFLVAVVIPCAVVVILVMQLIK